MGDIEIKIAHCADLHIGSSSNTSEILKSFYNLIEICTNPDINILLISGDLFDSLDVSQDDLNIVKNELKNIKIPVYISPGNHDPYISNTIHDTEWPENVHIFKSSKINFFEIPEHETRIYGAGFNDIYELESLFKADNNLDKNYINICVITQKTPEIIDFGCFFLLFGAKVGKDSFLRLEFDPILTPEFANKLYRKQFVFERCWNYAFGSDQHLS